MDFLGGGEGLGNPLHKQESKVSPVVSTIFRCSPLIVLERIWIWVHEVIGFGGKKITLFDLVPWSVRR